MNPKNQLRKMIKMKIKNKKLIENFNSFFKTLTKSDKIAILHHTDPDGVSSAVLVNKLVKSMRNKSIDLRLNQRPEEYFITNNTLKKLNEKKINKFIIVDLSVDQANKDNILNIEKFADILILDHHKLYKNLNSNNTTHIKPQLVWENVKPEIYCTSKLVFDLGLKIANITQYDWIAALGIIGDNTVSNWEK